MHWGQHGWPAHLSVRFSQNNLYRTFFYEMRGVTCTKWLFTLVASVDMYHKLLDNCYRACTTQYYYSGDETDPLILLLVARHELTINFLYN